MTHNELNYMVIVTCGLCPGVLTNPMDVVTARLMTQQSSIASSLPHPVYSFHSQMPALQLVASSPYKGVGDCIVRMVREEGVSSLFAGVGARVIWIAPFTAISLCLNESFKRELLRRKTRKRSDDDRKNRRTHNKGN